MLLTPNVTANAFSTRCRMPASSPTPSAITGSCIMARARHGTCATSTCSTTLKTLARSFHGTDSKAIVWAHNSHVGNAAATEMAARGEHNIGHLCRKEFGDDAYAIGFGTDCGTVAAASDWDGPMEVKKVQPALPKSYERLCHDTGHARFTLGLRHRSDLTGADGLASRSLSGRSASSTGRKPSSPVTISRRSCRGNSTSTSGSMKPARSRRSRPPNWPDCLIPIPLGCERRCAGLQGHSLCPRQAELDALGTHLAQWAALHVD